MNTTIAFISPSPTLSKENNDKVGCLCAEIVDSFIYSSGRSMSRTVCVRMKGKKYL